MLISFSITVFFIESDRLLTFIIINPPVFVLVLILYLFKLMGIKSAGVFAVFTVVGLGVATCSLKTSAMWYFPMANTIVWLHYTEILRDPVIPISKSYLYFTVIIIGLFICNLVALK